MTAAPRTDLPVSSSAPRLTSQVTRTVALIGNPNVGKSTLFSALSGIPALTGNYPGCTVEKKIGLFKVAEQAMQLVDLPGTYSLAPRTLDEAVSVDLLLGRQPDEPVPDVVLCIVDASNLERNLYLVSQVLDLERPVILAVNMMDVARQRGIRIDLAGLSQRLGCPVFSTEAHRRQGIDDLRQALATSALTPPPVVRLFPTAFYEECRSLQQWLEEQHSTVPGFLVERLLLDVGGYLEKHLTGIDVIALQEQLQAARQRLAAQGCKVPSVEARVRYGWVRTLLEGLIVQPATRPVTLSDRIDHYLTHRVTGLLFFALMMFTIFQALYTGASPLMDGLQALQGWLSDRISSVLAPGPLRSLLNDGVLAGVGGVLIFLPQIALLFFFIALLEDCGYMARAAFLMDRLMSRIGLSGKSFVPLMSSFACAIPGVMATRVIENRRDRFTTILIAPLMSCSARQPVYMLMIFTFIPAVTWFGGWLGLQGIMLFLASSLGALVAIPIAWLLKKTLLKGETPPFVMELPSYKWPSPWIVATRVYESSRAFVVRAGSLIFLTSILVWAACYYPGDHTESDRLTAELEQMSNQLAAPIEQRSQWQAELETVESQITAAANTVSLADLESRRDALQLQLDDLSQADLLPYDQLVRQRNQINGQLLERSLLGRMGQTLEPIFRPLGWNWKIGVAVLASFPAREVVVATLGTIYSLGGEVSEADPSLQSALKESRWEDGRPVFTIPVALSIMVFFALCAQCASTLMVIRRETNSRGWAFFTFAYMTLLAYVAAWATYQVGTLLIG